MTNAERYLDEIAEQTGWGDSSKLLIACRYIEALGLAQEFEEFLEEEAAEERAYAQGTS